MVPRGGIQAVENLLCFQMVRTHAIAGLANKNTNKIFLWIGSVPDIALFAQCHRVPTLSQKPIAVATRVWSR
ncbi:hypothetical protein BQ8794_240001 [Mesorhizobium prunaredense]|uniref:Uncharacterized protein n=1 Tax=Mesorhizobium prunaredense TaxID=1631249 RepID=A0A1R3V7B9_9HYPH|nr:hypothetical protein BQ8794_240001 [Mesorhizobium prunaredense]